mmetsp:Transcript_11024/g.15885  ORF Transcript_11024/g.15885 Transcript_11024/m.15885 type:complete len:158 (+) Transcript_11024:1120-1593(+)
MSIYDELRNVQLGSYGLPGGLKVGSFVLLGMGSLRMSSSLLCLVFFLTAQKYEFVTHKTETNLTLNTYFDGLYIECSRFILPVCYFAVAGLNQSRGNTMARQASRPSSQRILYVLAAFSMFITSHPTPSDFKYLMVSVGNSLFASSEPTISRFGLGW